MVTRTNSRNPVMPMAAVAVFQRGMGLIVFKKKLIKLRYKNNLWETEICISNTKLGY
jgi:hypothetical protein